MNEAKKRLLIASTYFFPKTGGLENYAYHMAKKASRDGFKVSVITTGNSNKIELSKENNLNIYRLPIFTKLSNTPLNLKWHGMVKEIFTKENPSIINVHMPVVGLADLVCLSAKNRPVAVTYHAGSMKKGKFFSDRLILAYERFFLPKVLEKTNKIICSSDFVRFDFLRRYQNKSVTINPGVDLDLFTKRKTLPVDHNVLFIGNFNYNWKGLKVLKEAVGLIPQAVLHVVGQGKKDNAKNVIYHGVLKGRDLVTQIHKAKVLVLPSTSQAESFGMVLIEAMASGVPVIGTSIGGIKTIISDKKDGLLVMPNDVKALAESISYILDNPNIASNLAKSAYQKVVKNFTWDKSTSKYIEVINSLVKERK